MKVIKPSYEIWEQGYDLASIYKQIERAGRVCYKSEDKITDKSAKPFVRRLIKAKHYAMLEHGTVYLALDCTSPMHDPQYLEKMDLVFFYKKNKYSIVKEHTDDNFQMKYYITTNLRVIIENNRVWDLFLLCPPTEHHAKRYTVHFTCNQQVSHEFVRHKHTCAA